VTERAVGHLRDWG